MRKLLRSIAKERMRQEGVPHPCRKHDSFGCKQQSVFSRYWKVFAGIETAAIYPQTKKANKRKRKAKAKKRRIGYGMAR